MPKISVTDSNGVQHSLDYNPPQNLMELLRDADFEEIAALCGGNCSCATCHLHLDKPEADNAQFTPADEIEVDLLDLADNFDVKRSRLSCQLQLEDRHDGLNVTLLSAGW